MEAATPAPDSNGHDPLAALQRRFAAMDVVQEAQYSETKEVIKNGRAAVSRIKESVADSKNRMCIKDFTASDEARCDEIEAAAEEATAQRHQPVTEVLDPSEVRARLDAAVRDAETRKAAE